MRTDNAREEIRPETGQALRWPHGGCPRAPAGRVLLITSFRLRMLTPRIYGNDRLHGAPRKAERGRSDGGWGWLVGGPGPAERVHANPGLAFVA